nr:reverse transcriptase domain-containing protein [Tanacetum cinerariifolium]
MLASLYTVKNKTDIKSPTHYPRANELTDAFGKPFEKSFLSDARLIFKSISHQSVGFNSLVHSLRALSTLRCSGLRTASTAAKPCQGDSSELYLITGNIYKGYHQIKMAKEDKEKTTFIISQGIFCYSKMPFGLKNARETYQRLVDKAFQKQIGKNLEVYVDDLVIKSRMKHEIIRDIKETFKTLREINIKLNLKKCTFRIKEGMFLGYKVNAKRIKVCPNKVEAVLSLPSLKCLKVTQKLNGKLASLNRFLSKSAENSFPFFKTLKKYTKKSDFQWTMEAEAAFKQMKKLIAELPTLTAPMEKEELIIYVAKEKETMSAVLMMEREAKQMLIYFISRVLQGLEINYTQWKNWY